MTKANTLFFSFIIHCTFPIAWLAAAAELCQRRQLKYRKRYIYFSRHSTAIDRMMLPAWAWWWWRLTCCICLCGKIGLCGRKGTTFTILISNQNWNELSRHSGALTIEVNTTCIPQWNQGNFFSLIFAHIFIDKKKEKKRITEGKNGFHMPHARYKHILGETSAPLISDSAFVMRW